MSHKEVAWITFEKREREEEKKSRTML